MSINGPTTWNDTVMIGNRVTKFPVNLMAWQMLPDHTIRNWADMTSYTTYNKPNMTPLETFLASNITDPNHISQWDPMLFSLGCPQMYQNNTMTNPFLTQMGLNLAYQHGQFFANNLNNYRVNSMIQGMATSLATLENQLTELIKNDQLTDSQKEKLEAKLEEVKAFKERIEEALQEQPSIEDVQALAGELVELQKSITEVIKEIAKEVKESKDDNNEDDGVHNNDDDSKKSDTDKTGRPASLGEAPTKEFLRDVCGKFSDAVNVCYGTDDTDFEDVLGIIDAGNVVEIMQYFNKNYGDDINNTFLDNFLGDAEHFQKKKFGRSILNALITRAEALGIEDEIEKDIASANSEFNDYNISKHLIKRYLTNILDKIVAKEKANATDKKSKSDKTEADKKKDDAKKAQEAKATFLADMKEFWDDDKLEISDKVQYKDGKFKIHTVKGKSVDYEASDFIGLVKKLEKDGLDPKEYLVKKAKVNAKA